MDLIDVLGAPVSDPPSEHSRRGDRCADRSPPPPLPGPRQQGRRWWLIVAALCAVAVGIVAGWLVGRSTATSAPQDPLVEIGGVPAEVASTAELFASLYLAGADGEDLASIYAGDPPPPSGSWVNHSAVVSAEMTGEETWSVVVALDSLEPMEGRYEPVGLGFYEVSISTESGRPIVTAPPARIPAPRLTAATTTSGPPTPDEQRPVVAQFLGNYLTGGDDLPRYLAPDHSIARFDDDPYRSITVGQTQSDPLGRVRAHIAAVTERGATHQLEYTLTLVFVDGVWMVSDIGSVNP